MIATGDRTYDSGGPTDVLGTETDLRSFLGVVDGENGPWAVGVHLARVEHEGDVVVAASMHRTPTVAPTSGGGGSEEWPCRWSVPGARALIAATNSRYTSG